ncbi:MAG: fibronectin type III domain-containing protein, partial [Candidatus Shapirobacteria bacterium]
PGGTPIITNTINGDNSVTLTWSKASNPVTKYLIAYGTSSGSIEFGNPNVGNADTTSYTIKGLSGGTRYYFKIKAINDCIPGDWSNEVSSIPIGGTRAVVTVAEGFVPASEISNRLLDIALIVDKTQITKASELTARVTFVSFGKEDTPVEMTFTIVDANGKEYYRSIDNTSIQTEGVFNKTFEGLLLDKGKYTLVLNTLYNTNIKDEFKQNFEVGDFTSSTATNFLENKPLMIIIGGGIILILISWIIGLVKRRKKNSKDKEHRV